MPDPLTMTDLRQRGPDRRAPVRLVLGQMSLRLSALAGQLADEALNARQLQRAQVLLLDADALLRMAGADRRSGPADRRKVHPPHVHYQVDSSTVRCGAGMRDAYREGWDLGTCTVDLARVTCPTCLDLLYRPGTPEPVV